MSEKITIFDIEELNNDPVSVWNSRIGGYESKRNILFTY